VISPNRFARLNLAIGQQAQIAHEGELVFGQIDFPTEQGCSGAMFPRIM
jgi:hypothetical protein